ncbi:MAG: hypothetical protein ACOCQR_01915 [bacterium]
MGKVTLDKVETLLTEVIYHVMDQYHIKDYGEAENIVLSVLYDWVFDGEIELEFKKEIEEFVKWKKSIKAI